MSTPSVLFVCAKNGGKSQMAAALARLRAHGAMEVYSAGTRPGSSLNDVSRESIAELGATFNGEYPKPIDPDLLLRVDRVVIVGGDAEVAPVEGMRGSIVKWDIDEPSLRGIDGRERMDLVRDDIDHHVIELIAELTEPSNQ